jgi:hypothetical protein
MLVEEKKEHKENLHKDYPQQTKTATVLSTAKIWSWVPEELSAKMEKLTDNQFQSNWLW